ncbi:MAG: cyclopropane fatty-acyl-phospholipid synthase-like methyltransferase [Bacteroidia bacterium]|jgi:cyclopropane fatty-acyl-phospholipid synthase-like methyltransferase
MEKPFSQACENNKQPIFDVILPAFTGRKSVLEIGSGTGQHAVFFASQLTHLHWQCSDQAEYLPGIRAWIEDAGLSNVAMPLELDVMKPWPLASVPAIFSANTVHIMHWPQVEALFTGIKQHLDADGDFCLYGPFNYQGAYSSDSNVRFDQWLKQRDPGMGIRDIEAIIALAESAGLQLQNDHAMPANNRLLHFRKQL